MVKILKVNIDDLIPSARQLRGTVRSVLWGIVEALVESKNEDIRKISEQEVTERLDVQHGEKAEIERIDEEVEVEGENEGDYLIDTDELSKSQMREQILAMQMGYDQSDHKDDQLQGNSKNEVIDIDINEFDLPLSFGSSSHAYSCSSPSRKKSKKSKGGKKKKNQNKSPVPEKADSYYRNSAGCPLNFAWNKELRIPDESIGLLEYNVYMIDIEDCYDGDDRIQNIIDNNKAIFEDPESVYFDTNTKRYPVRVIG
jgi:hypothetical protein